MALQIQQLGAVALSAKALLSLAQETSAETVAQVEELKATLGFDLTTVDGLRDAGLDPKRPAAVAAMQGGQAILLVLPIADAKRYEKTLRSVALSLWRADKIAEEKIGQTRVVRMARSFGDREVILGGSTVDVGGGLALLALGDGYQQALKSAAELDPRASLARYEPYLAARRRVREGRMLLWLDDAGPLVPASQMAGVGAALEHAVISADVDRGGLWLEALAHYSEASRQGKESLLRLEATPPDMLTAAGDDAVLVVAGNADVQALLAKVDADLAPQTGGIDQLARRAGVDLDREVLKRLRGGIGAALSLGPVSEIAGELRRMGRAARALGRVARLHVVAELTQEGAADIGQVLERYFTERGLQVVQRSVGDGVVSTATLRAGAETREFHYAVRGETLIFGIDAATNFDAVLGRVSAKAQGGLSQVLPAALREDLQGKPGGMALVSFSTLARKLLELSDAAALKDPVTQSTVAKAAKLVGKLQHFSLHVGAEPDGLRARARVGLARAAR